MNTDNKRENININYFKINIATLMVFTEITYSTKKGDVWVKTGYPFVSFKDTDPYDNIHVKGNDSIHDLHLYFF